MGFVFDKSNLIWQLDKRGLPECLYKIKVPSVSTVLSIIPDPDYENFVKSVGKEKAEMIMKLAAYRGTAMHKYVEKFLEEYNKSKDVARALAFTQEISLKELREEGIPEDKIAQGLKMFYAFYYSDYVTQYENVVKIEFPIFSSKFFYRGILDILYKDKLFGLSITDLKSSNERIKKGSIKELKYFYQLGAYAFGFEQMYPNEQYKVNKASILCIHKEGEFIEEISLLGKELEDYKEKFKKLLIEYHILNKQEYLIQDYVVN